MGYSSVVALQAPGKDIDSLTKHFEALQENVTDTDADEAEFNSAAFWRAPLPTAPDLTDKPKREVLRVELRFVASEDGDPNDAATVLHVDDEHRENLQMSIPVGESRSLESPVGRRWHVRSEQTKALLHSFTATLGMGPVEVRARRLVLEPLQPSLRQRLAKFEADFTKEHGRPPTPADGPNLPVEVIQMYRDYTASLNMTPEETKRAVAKLEEQAKAKAEAKAKADAASKVREEARAKQWAEWEATQEKAWAEAKAEAHAQRDETVTLTGGCDGSVLTGAATWVKTEEPTRAPLTKEAYLQRARDKFGILDTSEEIAAELEAAEAEEWARRGGADADAVARGEALRDNASATSPSDDTVASKDRCCSSCEDSPAGP